MMKRHLIQALNQNSWQSQTDEVEDKLSLHHKTFEKTQFRPNYTDKVDYSSQKQQSQRKSRETSNSVDQQLTNSLKSSFQTEDDTLLDFTFCKQQNQANKITSDSKISFQNHNLQAVLLYALLFNHVHLSELTHNLTNITKRSLEVYNLVKKHLLVYDQYAEINHVEEFLFPSITFRLLECKELDIVYRRQHLKQMINSMDSTILASIFQNILQELHNRRIKESCNKRVSKDGRQMMEEATRIVLFAEELGINVKIQSQERTLCFGRKESCICVSIVKNTEKRVFCLKKVACYQQ